MRSSNGAGVDPAYRPPADDARKTTPASSGVTDAASAAVTRSKTRTSVARASSPVATTPAPAHQASAHGRPARASAKRSTSAVRVRTLASSASHGTAVVSTSCPAALELGDHVPADQAP